MTDSPSVTCPSPAMTTLSLRRTQRTVVERIRRRAGGSAMSSLAAATSGFFFMSAILNYSSAISVEFAAFPRGSAVCVGSLWMYKEIEYMYITCNAVWVEAHFDGTASRRAHKHFQLDAVKIKRAQKALRAKTETETIERALDLAISAHESNRLTLEAKRAFPQKRRRNQRRFRKIGSLDASC